MLARSFLFIVVGAGVIRPCSLPFGADQFYPGTESGRRGINSFFNWYYFILTIAVVGSSTGIIYVQSNVSWCVGFVIPAALMFASCVLFFAGAGLYVRVRPEGIPLASVFRVAVAAVRKRRAPEPEDPAAMGGYRGYSPYSQEYPTILAHFYVYMCIYLYMYMYMYNVIFCSIFTH